jgi:hypothetical protein
MIHAFVLEQPMVDEVPNSDALAASTVGQFDDEQVSVVAGGLGVLVGAAE